MILTELASGIALRFERRGDRASLCWYADLGTSLADRRHAGADRQFAHDEVRATRRATRLSVIIGEQHPFLGELVEVRRPPGHQSTMVSANVPHADVIAHDEHDVWFLSCACASAAMNATNAGDGPCLSILGFDFITLLRYILTR